MDSGKTKKVAKSTIEKVIDHECEC
jgi:hypothetical protein